MTTVVVGAARGIGEAVARRLATESWAGKVVLADLLIDETESVASDLAKAGHDVEAIAVDLRDDESIASLVQRTREADKVALVAGIFKPSPSLEVTRADLERILSVNTFGTFMVAQGYAREMVERGEGSIVAIGSIAARMPRACVRPPTVPRRRRCARHSGSSPWRPSRAACGSTSSRPAPPTPR